MPPGASVDVTVRLQALGGQWETCGADRAIKVVPETVQCSANEWGPDKASFELHRSPLAIWPDIGAFTPVEIEIGGVIVWEGRTSETPLRLGSEQVINVQCQGWQYHCDDDVYQRIYVHSKLTDWRDARSFLGTDLTRYVSQPQVVNDRGGIVLSYPANTTVAANATVGVILDSGPGLTAARIVLEWQSSNNTPNISLFARATSEENPVGIGNDAFSFNNNLAAAGVSAGSFPTAARYVHLFLIFPAGGAIGGADVWMRLKGIRVFADPTYEGGNASVLKASTVVKDALERDTLLLSSDYSQVAPTTFAISDFALSKQSTAREAIEAANAYHNYVTKLLIGRRFSFQPRPTGPTLEIGAGSQAAIEDTSANNGAEIFSRALIEASGPDGSPLIAERSAAQQPGVFFSPSSSPAPNNPSFAENTTSWTASGASTITRDTTVGDYHSAPAAGKWQNAAGQTLTETFNGTFLKGVTYLLSLWLKGPGETVRAQFGTTADHALAAWSPTPGVYTLVSVAWTPGASVAGVTLVLSGGAELIVDDLALSSVRPTLADRRGFRRTKVIQTSSAVTATEGNQLADIFLQAHMGTPFKGSATVTPGSVRRVLGGQPVHPSQLGLHTQELIRLAHLIDPDTGAVGRDATIAEATYTHKDQKAQVTLDDKRANFDALLARLAVVQSVGS